MVLFLVSCKPDQSNLKSQEESTVENERIVSLNGAITETIYALGNGENIVGKDVTSTFPENSKAIDLGHVNQLTIEPILSTSPTLILFSEKDINSELFNQIDRSEIRLENVEHKHTIEGAKSLIENIATTIGVQDYQHLIDKIDADFAKVEAFDEAPKVLFIYARENFLMVAGKNTAMQSMIELAGGKAAITEFEDFKPLTPEALLQINPDVIMFFDKVELEEIHHTQKLDKPSGTAITLAEEIIQNNNFTHWESDQKSSDKALPIYSKRIDKVPGTHTIAYRSEIDDISITHTAHNRKGFALGAVIAAEWIKDKKGYFSMKNVLNLK